MRIRHTSLAIFVIYLSLSVSACRPPQVCATTITRGDILSIFSANLKAQERGDGSCSTEAGEDFNFEMNYTYKENMPLGNFWNTKFVVPDAFLSNSSGACSFRKTQYKNHEGEFSTGDCKFPGYLEGRFSGELIFNNGLVGFLAINVDD